MENILGPNGQPAVEAPVAEPTLDEKLRERNEEVKKVVDECEYGYVVAVLPDGNLMFQQIGSKQGFIELLGLHQFATYRVNVMSDVSQQYGPALMANQLGQIGQMLNVLVKMQTQQAGQLLNVKR